MNLVQLQERRAIRRAIQIDCEVVRERDFKLVGKKTFDLSTDGMLVPTSLDVDPGDELIVSFYMTPLGIHFDTEATAARIIRGVRREDREGPCVGVQFRPLDPIARHILRGALRRVPPP
ncbi:MAG: PilZ domain-containing protein, partial [Polyangiaceae bacterium]